MRRRRLFLLASFVLAVLVSAAGVALAQPSLDEQQTVQAQEQQQASLLDDKEGVIDTAGEAHAEHDEQHGGQQGHLPPRRKDIRVVGKAAIDSPVEGRVSDVGVFGNYAYLGAFNEPDCQRGGVYVFNTKDPTSPRQVNFIEAAPGSYVGEGVQVVYVTTPKFDGDLLIHNNEICSDDPAAEGGVSLYDVSDPRNEEKLASGVGDEDPEAAAGTGAHQVHSAFAWDVGRKAYAALVDDEEGADLDIMDITDPRAPKLIAEYDLNERFPQIVQEDLGTAESFLHDMVVKKIDGRWVMSASYWDGGYVTLDVTDPTNATYLADSDFKNPDPEAKESGLTVAPEGNAHQSEFSLKNNFIVAADEDFSPYSVEARNTTDDAEFDATQGSDTPQVDADRSLEGQTVFVGRACTTDTAVPAGDGSQVAVVERGVCGFTEKVQNVENAGGYAGVIVMNREGPDACSDLLNMDVQGTIPALFVGRDTGFAFFDAAYDEDACRVGDGTAQAPIEVGTTGDTVSVRAVFDGWGYAHLFRNGEGKLRELDTYAIPEAHDERFAEGFGDLSIHETAMSGERNDLAYLSYYSGGFRVAKIQNGNLREVGSYVSRGGNNFWGVQTFGKNGKEYVAASDRDYGLYVFEYTGPR
ncbi:hypothetical protein GBA63_19000 [Rubrobacter tropicus]|uniref:PA domain-containing protein n=1 Tax=Rubrobacter tropicus TaxID=2653851 RepID=A0A6G8QE29_9ACTN|nr:PA domain-containing protein [Rubrobacter tropicus]QIN84497.1 hypothetical protein GBA63_19000 [Rubrobacter tropicus]